MDGIPDRAFTRKKGRGNITVDELVRTITPKGRGVFILQLISCLVFQRGHSRCKFWKEVLPSELPMPTGASKYSGRVSSCVKLILSRRDR